jgi:hypothetical protein
VRNPSLAKARDVSYPIPLELPVTRATLFDFIIILTIKMQVYKLASN